MLDKLLGNPLIKSMVLGKLTTYIKEESISCIVLRLDDKGEITGDIHKESMKILPQAEYDKMIESLKSIL